MPDKREFTVSYTLSNLIPCALDQSIDDILPLQIIITIMYLVKFHSHVLFINSIYDFLSHPHFRSSFLIVSLCWSFQLSRCPLMSLFSKNTVCLFNYLISLMSLFYKNTVGLLYIVKYNVLYSLFKTINISYSDCPQNLQTLISDTILQILPNLFNYIPSLTVMLKGTSDTIFQYSLLYIQWKWLITHIFHLLKIGFSLVFSALNLCHMSSI